MDIVVKHFNELTNNELYEVMKIRTQVFIVEQNCPYQDIDNKDKEAYHIYFKEESNIIAYIRVLPKGISFDEASVGRVISLKRRCGLGSKILAEGIRVAKEKFNADIIKIEAQVYAREFYEKAGFRQISDEFIEDGIPHILMQLTI